MMTAVEKRAAREELTAELEAELCRKLTLLEKVQFHRNCNLTFAYIDEQETKSANVGKVGLPDSAGVFIFWLIIVGIIVCFCCFFGNY